MTVTEFKRICSALSTFSTVRDKASGPETLIGVQAKDGVLKLIAANRVGGVTVTADIGSDQRATFTVLARPLLSTAKVLKGKLDLRFVVSEDSLQLVSDKGGSVVWGASGSIKDAGFARKPRDVRAIGFIPKDGFGQVSKLFDTVQRDIEASTPTFHFYDDTVRLTAVSPVNKEMYATFAADAKRLVEEEVYGSAYMDFWRALKIMDQDGTIEFGEGGAVARAGLYEVFSGPWKVSRYDPRKRISEPPSHPKPWPTFEWRGDPTASVVIDRKQLIEAIKGQMPNDEYQRVTLQVDTGMLGIFPYGAEAGMKLPATTTGKGIRSVQGALFLDMLRAFESKDIELAWASPSPAIRLNGENYSQWTVLIAPVTMSQ